MPHQEDLVKQACTNKHMKFHVNKSRQIGLTEIVLRIVQYLAFTKYAGVLYLTPNPPSESGTTIFEKGKQVDVENKYNRLIAYDGTQKHGATNFFGDNRSNGRMTFTFFIDRKRLIERQREKENFQYEFYDDFESKF